MHVVGSLADVAADQGVYVERAKGLSRFPLVRSPHQTLAIAELAPGGSVERHVHAFEEALFVLAGSLVLSVRERDEELAADDYAYVETGVPHALANRAGEPARWLELSAPPQGAPGLLDTAFGELEGAEAEVGFVRARFDESELPAPSGALGLAGFAGGNVAGASLKMLIDRAFGASAFNLLFLEYASGGTIKEHDHAFEEAFFFLTGEIEAVLDGQTYTLRAGDFCWSAVQSMHSLTNRSDAPVRWIETQVPQPPPRHAARFKGDWERLTGSA
jgi:quercetin dioxygenase-like cupin family protein